MKKIICFALVAAMLLLVSCKNQNTNKGSVISPSTKENIAEVEPTDNTQKTESLEEIVLYYPDAEGQKLKKDIRFVSDVQANDAEFILKTLIEGTQTQDCINVIPFSTTINSCEVDSGICTVDLSGDFLTIQGTLTKELAVYSIVNTLCSINGVDKVVFFIDGEKLSLFGNMYLEEPIEANMTIAEQ